MGKGLEVLTEIKKDFIKNIINLGCFLDVVFMPGSFIRECRRLEPLQKGRSNYHLAVGAEWVRGALYLSTAYCVYYLKGW